MSGENPRELPLPNDEPTAGAPAQVIPTSAGRSAIQGAEDNELNQPQQEHRDPVPVQPDVPATDMSYICDQLSQLTRVIAELRDEIGTVAKDSRKLREDCRVEFDRVNDRINRSRQNERDLANEQRRSASRSTAMPGLMPTDVKTAKMKNFSSTKIDEIRDYFRHARGHLKYHNVDPEEPRSVYWFSCYLEGPLSKWWSTRIRMTGDEIGGGFSGITEMEAALVREFCGRDPAEQARINLDKAKQRSTVLKYANYFREQLLELPHRHEDDNVHDFVRGLKPSIQKEVAMKDPRTLSDAVQAALRAESAENKIESGTRTNTRTGALNNINEDSTDEYDYDSDADSTGTHLEDDDTENTAELKQVSYRKLSEKDQAKFKKEGRCFRCGQKGHRATDCPKKKKGN